MKPSKITTILVLAFSLQLLFSSTSAQAQTLKDRWYIDVPNQYWAYHCIRTLWEEDVTDGYQYTDYFFPENNYSKYYPEDDCSRGQYTMMLAKIFSLPLAYPVTPSFLDVPSTFCLYYTKLAYPYIEAANYAGFLNAFENTYFYPDQEITREEATVMLVSSLNLADLALDLTEEEVNDILNIFSDAHQININNRPSIALAVKLKIIFGYNENGRELRPLKHLSRDEAAAILYRSCLIRVQAEPVTFNPYGDGEHETTTFELFSLKNRSISRGFLFITCEDNQEIYKIIEFDNWPTAHNQEFVWDGTDDQGHLLPPGEYHYFSSVWDRSDFSFSSPIKPIKIDRKILNAVLEPTTLKPADTIRITAYTHDDALSVEAILESGDTVALNKNNTTESTQSTWIANYQLPPDTTDGVFHLTVKAHYPFTELSQTLKYTVFDPLTITGSIHPSVVEAGKNISINANTFGNAIAVYAHLPFGPEIKLSEAGNALWQTIVRIPVGTHDGFYTVFLNAKSLNKSVWLPLNFQVCGNILADYHIVLSD